MADSGGNNTTIVIKKIKKGGHGHHGGAWKVAYADFVTAMMAFFLVMWIVAMSQDKKEAIQNYFQNQSQNSLFNFFQGVFKSEQGQQMMPNTKRGGVTNSARSGGLSRLHLLATDLESGLVLFKPEIYGFRVHPDKIQFAITAESLFNPGSVLLRPEAEPLMNKIAELLKGNAGNIIVEAHTDDLPPEDPKIPTNWELTAQRAATVVRYFIEGHQFDPAQLTAMGAGEYRPIADNRTPEGRAKNRRIDVYVIPDRDNRFSPLTAPRTPASEGAPATSKPGH